ncbi:MAG: hypothetical protein ACJ76N_09985 [Thermoanaerobaculia bacterium]
MITQPGCLISAASSNPRPRCRVATHPGPFRISRGGPPSPPGGAIQPYLLKSSAPFISSTSSPAGSPSRTWRGTNARGSTRRFSQSTDLRPLATSRLCRRVRPQGVMT